jgi:hypothetical protein
MALVTPASAWQGSAINGPGAAVSTTPRDKPAIGRANARQRRQRM